MIIDREKLRRNSKPLAEILRRGIARTNHGSAEISRFYQAVGTIVILGGIHNRRTMFIQVFQLGIAYIPQKEHIVLFFEAQFYHQLADDCSGGMIPVSGITRREFFSIMTAND